MTYALIDNATLTAVQRVMGQIIVKTPDTINGDLVALENLVQAILFYDDLVCIDNYKDEHKKEREEYFSFIKFLSPNDYHFEEFEEQAKKEASLIRPEIRAGKFSDPDFRELLELLKLNMVCTWDLRSSVYYLTMKMLGQPNTPEFAKYSEISSSIFNELSDVGSTFGRWSSNVSLYGSDGVEHTKEQMKLAAQSENRGFGGTTRALDMFIASLNWLAYKSIYYSLTASYLQADTFLHPIRHAYQIHWFKKTGAFGHDFTSKLVQSLSGELSASISEVVDNGRRFAMPMEIPIFSAWLTHDSGNVNNVIDSALELKNSEYMQEIRGILKEIRLAYDDNNIAKSNKSITKWEKELIKASANLKATYGLQTEQGIQGSKIMKVYNSGAALSGFLPKFPEFNFKVPLPQFVINNTSNGFSTLFKDVAKELVSTERLGGVRDIMASKFIIDDKYYAAPKTESPEYRNFASDWKIPM
ncbi:hypothetical protein [uncultured Gammaproteobacteria bacterium]|nr:hypothetical protein [uncultured Gammaproteobacteria bacterium]